MFTKASKENLTQTDLFQGLFDFLDARMGVSQVGHVITWAESLLLDGRPFSLHNHEYQRDMLTENASRQVFLKGAQVGVTSIQMLKTLHGLISGRYPQGALYLFPSLGDVQDFSRGRFNPLINDNDIIARFVQDTDTMGIKRIGNAMLYMRGARATSKVGGFKRSSAALKSVPADRLVLDERDEMADDMVDLARERLSHSEVKDEVHLSTPTIPDYGVDKLFQDSDQRHSVGSLNVTSAARIHALSLNFLRVWKNCRKGLSGYAKGAGIEKSFHVMDIGRLYIRARIWLDGEYPNSIACILTPGKFLDCIVTPPTEILLRF